MEKKELSPAYRRKRKMLVVMPLLVIPFLTMGFWALGGGRGRGDEKAVSPNGLNPTLPDARLKEEKTGGKLSFYDQAARDSVKLAEWMRSDPYYKSQPKSAGAGEWEEIAQRAATQSGPSLNPSLNEQSGAAPEEQILEKLTRLRKELDDPPAPKERNGEKTAAAADRNPELSREVDRLEHLMTQMKTGSAEDPGMDRLQSVMDKILDIQHPERVRRRLEEVPTGTKEAVNELQPEPSPTTVSLFHALQQQKEKENRSGFYSGEQEKDNEHHATAIQAVVHGEQTLTDGMVVKLRLTEDMQVGDAQIPKGSFVYGRAALGKERLLITVNSLRHNSSLYPVALEVYDLDGIAGISIPGTGTREVVGASADRSLGSLELSSLDPSLKAKAASASLGAVKNLLSRKVRQAKVTVKAGYRVLLKDKKAKP